MSGYNQATVVGYLGGDPESKQVGVTTCARFQIATSRKYTTKKNGKDEEVEETEWHSIQVWGVLADNCVRYLHKGRQALVVGRLKTEKWQSKEGHDKQRTIIIADTVQFLGPAAGGR